MFDKVFINLTFFSQFSNLFFCPVKNGKSQHFKLVVEANVKCLHYLVYYLFSHFIKNNFLILTGICIKIGHCFFYDFLTLILKVRNWSIFGSNLKLLNFMFNLLKSFPFDFGTSILSYHFSLIRQIKFFLTSNYIPSFVDINGQTINRNTTTFFFSIKRIFVRLIKFWFQFVTFFIKSFFFKVFMWDHHPLKAKEFFNFNILKVIWFVNFTPDFSYILH